MKISLLLLMLPPAFLSTIEDLVSSIIVSSVGFFSSGGRLCFRPRCWRMKRSAASILHRACLLLVWVCVYYSIVRTSSKSSSVVSFYFFCFFWDWVVGMAAAGELFNLALISWAPAVFSGVCCWPTSMTLSCRLDAIISEKRTYSTSGMHDIT